MIEITVDTRRAVITNRELLTTGSAGIGVNFALSGDWDDLVKFACFRNGEIEESQIDIALGDSTQCSLPAENCDEQYVGEAVFAGIYGTDGNGNLIIPTIWVSIGGLRQGVRPGYASGPNPTPDMWAQITALAMSAGAENAAAAAQSASEADTSAEAAAESATSAGESATAAEQSAIQAANSALSASGSASSAGAAQTGAEAAQIAAEAAQTAAETAQGLAEDAQEASEAAQASIQNMTVSSSTLAEGASATVTKTVDAETGLVNLAFGIPRGDRPYVYELRPSVEAILYDPNQSVGSNISPTSVKLTAMRTKTIAEQFKAYISATLYYPDGTTRTYTASNAYSLTITLPTDIYGDCYIKAYCQNDAYGMSGRYAEVEIPVIAHGVKGDTGEGVPTGGTAGQFLKKSSSTDYDTEWADVDAGVTSVNGETGAVVLDASDVGAYALPSGGIPKTDLASAVQTSLGKADTALQTAPVTSVNTQTGDVVLDAGDIAYESTTVESELGTINSALTSLSAVTEIIDTASGAIASFPDGSGLPMRSLVAQIEPQQDLHGYDAPWAGGAGKNLLPMTLANMKTINYAGTWNGNVYTLAGVTFTINTDDGGNVASITANGTSTGTALLRLVNEISYTEATTLNGSPSAGGYNSFKIQAEKVGGGVYQDVGFGVSMDANVSLTRIIILAPSGTVLNNTVFYPMVRLQSVSDATFAPYSNECPITGWTGLSGARDGKNLIDWKVSSTAYSVFLKPNTYTLSWNGTFSQTGNWYLRGKDSNGDYYTTKEALSLGSGWTHASSSHWNYSGVSNPFTFTVPDGCTSIEFLRQNSDGTISAQLEVGSSATDFEAYQGTTITVSWQSEAGTVYGGTVDVVTGVLTVTDAIVDLGTLTYTYQSTYERFYATISDMKSYTMPRSVAFLCSCFEVISDKREIDQVPYGAIYNGSGININIKIQGITDATVFKNYVTGQTLVYKLAQPLVYHLSPQQIETLLGNNTVFVDTGSVSVTYQASIKGYIDKVLGA